MKLIKNTGILFSRDRGKEVILYETIDEIRDKFPGVEEDHLKYLKNIMSNTTKLVVGFVRGERWTPNVPIFTHVTEVIDTFEVLKDNYGE